MALIKCNECGDEVSSKAKSCPKCGAPVKKKGVSTGCGCLVILIAIVFFLWLIGGHVEKDQIAPAPQTAPSNNPGGNSDILGKLTNDERARLTSVIAQSKTKMKRDIGVGIAEKKLVVGMSREDVIRIWGKPSKTEPVGTEGGEIWKYPSGSWAMFAPGGMLFGFKEL